MLKSPNQAAIIIVSRDKSPSRPDLAVGGRVALHDEEGAPVGVGQDPHVLQDLVAQASHVQVVADVLKCRKRICVDGHDCTMLPSRAGHFRYFLIVSIIKNDFLHFLSS